jgi:hypothetical protein
MNVLTNSLTLIEININDLTVTKLREIEVFRDNFLNKWQITLFYNLILTVDYNLKKIFSSYINLSQIDSLNN